MASVNPYINFDGNCGAAFDFYKSVFGGEFATKMKFGEMPGGENMPASAKDRIMHVALPVGNTVIMGSDWSQEATGSAMVRGNSFAVSVQFTNEQSEAERVFKALSAGGNVTMPIAQQFWGAFFGMLVDKFGIQWMVNCEMKQG